MHGLTNEVLSYCISEGLLKPGMSVVTGVSGGADSVCLLRMLMEMSSELKLKIRCVHIEHGIRGLESRHDMEFVRALCERLDVPLAIYEEDVPARAAQLSMTVEEAGRYIRYEAFKEEAAKSSADVIAVAHHLNDQAETVLFNLARGSGLKGASGMAPRRGNIIRPLLNVSRAQIEAYLSDIGQDYCIDSTNADMGYSRNGIRGLILPELDKIVTGAAGHIAGAAREIREADDFIRSMAAKARPEIVTVREENRPDNKQVKDKNTGDEAAADKKGALYIVDSDKLTLQPAIIQRYIIRSVLTDIYTTHKDLEALHVNEVMGLTDKQSGRSIGLPKGMIALKEGKNIVMGSREAIFKPSDLSDGTVLNINGDTYVPGLGVISVSVEEYDGSEPPGGLYTKWFDYDKIGDALLVRTRREGDFLTIDDTGKRKKLKKYLVDEKVPVSERDSLILIADGGHIVWAVGMRISAHYKITAGTGRVMKVQLIRDTGTVPIS